MFSIQNIKLDISVPIFKQNLGFIDRGINRKVMKFRGGGYRIVYLRPSFLTKAAAYFSKY